MICHIYSLLFIKHFYFFNMKLQKVLISTKRIITIYHILIIKCGFKVFIKIVKVILISWITFVIYYRPFQIRF